MSDLFSLLSEAEIERLDQFLLDRIDEDAATDKKDEGVLDVSELDGLFTAIVSGPVTVHASKWLPAVWGDFEPVWESEKEFEAILTLMMRHMNCIAATLMEQPEDFEPLFLEREVKGKTHLIVDEWCEGYRRGVVLAEDQWRKGGESIAVLLSPVLAFTSATDWRGHDLPEKELVTMQEAIAPSVRQIHARWLARRDEFIAPARTSVKRSEPRVGRNDPCPCGSGKKYKHCCLH